MKKVFVYILVLVVALLLGGILGNVCANIEPLSWLDYMPPLNIKEHHWNLYVLVSPSGCNPSSILHR